MSGGNGKPAQGQHLQIDPLNPPKGWAILTIIQYPDKNGNIVQDVQSHVMRDLRNEDFVMAMIDSAKSQLIKWYKEQKAIRGIKDSKDMKIFT